MPFFKAPQARAVLPTGWNAAYNPYRDALDTSSSPIVKDALI